MIPVRHYLEPEMESCRAACALELNKPFKSIHEFTVRFMNAL